MARRHTTSYSLTLLLPLLGSMFQHGQGVKEDLEEAVKHYTTGADLGELVLCPYASPTLCMCEWDGWLRRWQSQSSRDQLNTTL